ncbi:MAG: bifunctional phosphopantothenoylcysteine decarboxylase/phosphopantothenate--cysteine ligase CoaBC [Desulfuromonadia bacterium]
MLTGKEIVLGVCGGIAAYKCVELARLLVKEGASVHVIMTGAACEFVTPLTFQTVTKNPVHTDLFNLIREREIGHISLADRADLFIIAPATANVVGKIAHGIADDMLTTTVMATSAPVLIAPAMNCAMYANPIYRENEDRLRRHGYRFVDPVVGMLACGWEGEGKFQEPQVIVEESLRILGPQDFAEQSVLVTAGPTVEAIDPVRFISNHSSGKMGYALARAAWRRGADVTLVTGPVTLPPPWGVRVIRVESAREMKEVVLREAGSAGVVIKAAAVADYRPVEPKGEKIKKTGERMTLELVRNPDILTELGRMRRPGQLIVGFAAETSDVRENAREKLRVKGADLMVANDVSAPDAGFSVDTNRVTVYDRWGGEWSIPLASKDQVADRILDRIGEVITRPS